MQFSLNVLYRGKEAHDPSHDTPDTGLWGQKAILLLWCCYVYIGGTVDISSDNAVRYKGNRTQERLTTLNLQNIPAHRPFSLFHVSFFWYSLTTESPGPASSCQVVKDQSENFGNLSTALVRERAGFQSGTNVLRGCCSRAPLSTVPCTNRNEAYYVRYGSSRPLGQKRRTHPPGGGPGVVEQDHRWKGRGSCLHRFSGAAQLLILLCACVLTLNATWSITAISLHRRCLPTVPTRQETMLFWSSPTQPARVPTDTVTPVRFFDDTIIFRTFTLYNLFVYDDVLDVEKLHNAVVRLVSRPGWNEAGA